MTQETWLRTGGAGYICARIADEFIRVGKSDVIYDSLYQGLERRTYSDQNTVKMTAKRRSQPITAGAR